MADMKAAKLAAARKKLKDHQEKKNFKQEDYTNNFEGNPQQVITYSQLLPNIQTEISSSKNPSISTPTSSLQPSVSNIDNETTVLANPVQNEINQNQEHKNIINQITVTEILVSEKRNLETKIEALNDSLQELKNTNTEITSHLNTVKQKSSLVEKDLIDAKEQIKYLQNELESKSQEIKLFKLREDQWLEIKGELEEKLDSATTAITAYKSQNSSLISQLTQCQRDLEMTQLQLQVLVDGGSRNNGEGEYVVLDNDSLFEKNESLKIRLNKLQQQMETMLNEKEQIASHYQHYIDELHKQIESAVCRNQKLEVQNEELRNREASLIDQLSQMEIRAQALQNHISVLDKQDEDNLVNKHINECDNLKKALEVKKEQLNKIEGDYANMRKLFSDSELKIAELNETIERMQQEQPDVLKLSAANESDKVAAQRATSQNAKLKEELQGLQEAFVIMSNDKLELTEKLQAEKFLNRELTIKLSEFEKLFKDNQSKLQAKDEEMIRLQENCSRLEKEVIMNSEQIDRLRHYEVTTYTELEKRIHGEHNENTALKLKNESDIQKFSSDTADFTREIGNKGEVGQDGNSIVESPIEANTSRNILTHTHSNVLATEEAMMKLQQRFLRTMTEVAELSEEKQNLEHIVLQLQGETETICEYIALYQQQRGILKQREEERVAQMKYLAAERERMQTRLEQLQQMIIDTTPDVSQQTDSDSTFKQEKVDKIVNLLTEIKQSHLVDPNKQCSGLQSFHPCPWCSGKLIDV